jgi:hypothetical protein
MPSKNLESHAMLAMHCDHRMKALRVARAGTEFSAGSIETIEPPYLISTTLVSNPKGDLSAFLFSAAGGRNLPLSLDCS